MLRFLLQELFRLHNRTQFHLSMQSPASHDCKKSFKIMVASSDQKNFWLVTNFPFGV
jgi:hypothetical protein